jgi:hypothetical protein
LDLGARKLLVSSEEACRGDLSRSKFINAKQSKIGAKVHHPVDRLKKEHCTKGPKAQAFIEVC